MSNSDIVMEVKKERFKRHLDEVEKLIAEWLPQLCAPVPFHASDGILWPVKYEPRLEQDQDNNHILRSHVRSRAFWRHHSDWAKKLEAIHQSDWAKKLEAIYQRTDTLLAATMVGTPVLASPEVNMRPTVMFVRVAIEDAFHRSLDEKYMRKYELGPEGDFWYGGLRIAREVARGEAQNIEEAHSGLIARLKCSDVMSEITTYWKDAKETEASMGKIVRDVLKSGDFIYPCRFCRRLFRG